MATENLDPESIRQYNESLQEVTTVLRELAMVMAVSVTGSTDLTKALKSQVGAYRETGNALDKFEQSIGDVTKLAEIERKAKEELAKEEQNLKTALNQVAGSARSFGSALLSTEQGLTKYGKTLDGLGDAALSLGKNFGLAGLAVGGIVKGFTALGSAALEQTDRTLKAADELSKIGSVGAQTTEDILKMAHGAGVTSKNLDLLTKPLSSMGSALVSLGTTAGDGVKAFGDMTKITKEQRMEYSRLGVSQAELIKNQADYVALQQASGRQITDQMKRDGSLKKASLEYTDNLLQLSALTGKDVERIKKEQEAALSREETLIQTNLMEQEIAALKESSLPQDKARAEQLQKEMDARNDLLKNIESQIGDTKMGDAMAKFLATGAITEESAALKRLGVPLEEFAARIKAGENVTGDFLNSVKQAGDAQLKNVGTAAMLDKSAREAYGYSKEFLQFLSKRRGKDENEAIAKAKEDRERSRKSGEDTAKDARTLAQETERSVQVAMDDLLKSTNPLISGFTLTTAAAGALATAAGLAALQLGKFALASKAGDIKDLIGSIAGKGSPLGKIAAPLAGVAKAAPIIGAVASVGAGAMGAYSGYKEAEAKEKSGELTAKEATVKKSEAVGGGTGTAAGGAAGAWIGGAIGTAILPGIGTALGATIGGWLGAKGGEMIGEAAGKFAGEKIADSSADAASDAAKKVAEDAKKKPETKPAEEKKPETTPAVKPVEQKQSELLDAIKISDDAKQKLKLTDTKRVPSGEELSKLFTADLSKEKAKKESISVVVQKIEDPQVLKALDKLGTTGSVIDKSPFSGLSLSNVTTGMTGIFGSVGSMASKLIDSTFAKTKKETPPLDKELTKYLREIPKISDPLAKTKINIDELIDETAIKQLPKLAPTPNLKLLDKELDPQKLFTGLQDATEEVEEKQNSSATSMELFSKNLEVANTALTQLTTSFNKYNLSIKELLALQEEQEETIETSGTAITDKFGKLLDVARNTVAQRPAPAAAPTERTFTPEQEKWLGGADRTDPNILRRMEQAVPSVTAKKEPPAVKPAAGEFAGFPGERGAPPTGVAVAKPAEKQDIKQNLGDIKAALMKRGMTDEKYLNAVLGNVMKESGGKVVSENLDYSKTSNERIRSIFKSATAGKTDEEINEMKSSPEKMAEAVYGPGTKRGRGMGNTEPGDGWKFRGRGFIQLTGKSNYAAASKAIFGDDRLVENPDLVNDPSIASEVVSWYMERGKSSMAKKMGIDPSNMSQEEANLLATSQIAGMDVRKSGGYLGGELLQKVAGHAASSAVTSVEPSPTRTASVSKQELPKAQFGGVFSGPTTGYPVELHGDELVAPLSAENVISKLINVATAPKEPVIPEMVQKPDTAATMSMDMMREIQAANSEMIAVLTEKLDAVIDKLASSNDIQDKILTYSRA